MKKAKIWERVFLWGRGGSHPKKLLLQRKEGHVKKIGKLREVMQFLNGDSHVPLAPPPSLK